MHAVVSMLLSGRLDWLLRGLRPPVPCLRILIRRPYIKSGITKRARSREAMVWDSAENPRKRNVHGMKAVCGVTEAYKGGRRQRLRRLKQLLQRGVGWLPMSADKRGCDLHRALFSCRYGTLRPFFRPGSDDLPGMYPIRKGPEDRTGKQRSIQPVRNRLSQPIFGLLIAEEGHLEGHLEGQSHDRNRHAWHAERPKFSVQYPFLRANTPYKTRGLRIGILATNYK